MEGDTHTLLLIRTRLKHCLTDNRKWNFTKQKKQKLPLVNGYKKTYQNTRIFVNVGGLYLNVVSKMMLSNY